MYKVLIVEDDAVIASAVQKHIQSWGYIAQCVRDFQHVLQTFVEFSPQLVLMDITLPFYNGYHWCGEIRKLSNVPVIFISSAADNMNIVMALEHGGDDFIAKPFDLNVLTAKVKAVLRRTYDFGGQSDFMQCGEAILNIGSAQLTFGGQTVELTKNENRILQALFENKGKVVTRDALMTRLWETDSFVDENTLTVNVTRLRKKLDGIGMTDWIQTKKGTGYLLNEHGEK